jgi:hypothetical protein
MVHIFVFVFVSEQKWREQSEAAKDEAAKLPHGKLKNQPLREASQLRTVSRSICGYHRRAYSADVMNKSSHPGFLYQLSSWSRLGSLFKKRESGNGTASPERDRFSNKYWRRQRCPVIGDLRLVNEMPTRVAMMLNTLADGRSVD